MANKQGIRLSQNIFNILHKGIGFLGCTCTTRPFVELIVHILLLKLKLKIINFYKSASLSGLCFIPAGYFICEVYAYFSNHYHSSYQEVHPK